MLFILVCAPSLVLWAVWLALVSAGRRPLGRSKLAPAPWGPLVGALAVLVLFAAQVVTTGLLAQLLPAADADDAHALMRINPGSVVLCYLAAYAATGAWIVLMAAQYAGTRWFQPLGLAVTRWRDVLKESAYGLAAAAMVIPLVVLIARVILYAAGKLDYDMPRQEMVEVLIDLRGKAGFFFVALQAIVLAPFFEELLFRGWLYQGLRRHMRAGGAATVCAAVFALVHYSIYAALPLFVLGLVLCYLFERTGRLIAPVALHLFFNALMVVLSSLAAVGGIREAF